MYKGREGYIYTDPNQERMKSKRDNPTYRPYSQGSLSLKLFLDVVSNSQTDNCTKRVARIFLREG